MREVVRRAGYLAVLALLFVAPRALAQASSPSNGIQSGVYLASHSTVQPVMGMFLQRIVDKGDRDCKPGRYDDRCKKTATMSEGGSAAVYFLLAGLACMGAIAFRFRRQTQPVKSA